MQSHGFKKSFVGKTMLKIYSSEISKLTHNLGKIWYNMWRTSIGRNHLSIIMILWYPALRVKNSRRILRCRVPLVSLLISKKLNWRGWKSMRKTCSKIINLHCFMILGKIPNHLKTWKSKLDHRVLRILTSTRAGEILPKNIRITIICKSREEMLKTSNRKVVKGAHKSWIKNKIKKC